ncbi:MAG TPA: DNA repair protein RecO, partial [Steroidobacteraceae bacterium]
MSVSARRVHLEPAFLLHHYPWRDTSRIFELLTRSHGRVSVFARASRKAASGTGTALQPFGELLVSWAGRGEAGQLTGAERVRPPVHLTGDRLMSGFYANELLMKLLERHDPHPRLFDAYGTLIAQLAKSQADAQRSLRLFEKRLLEELGWGL